MTTYSTKAELQQQASEYGRFILGGTASSLCTLPLVDRAVTKNELKCNADVRRKTAENYLVHDLDRIVVYPAVP